MEKSKIHTRPVIAREVCSPTKGLYPAGGYFTAAFDSIDHSHLFETHSSLCSENIRLPWFSSCLVGCSHSASTAGSSPLHQLSDRLCLIPMPLTSALFSRSVHSSSVTSRPMAPTLYANDKQPNLLPGHSPGLQHSVSSMWPTG